MEPGIETPFYQPPKGSTAELASVAHHPHPFIYSSYVYIFMLQRAPGSGRRAGDHRGGCY